MINRHLDEIIREGGDSGRIIGVKASYTPRFSPKTGKRLESFWSNGNIDETKQVIYIRARRAVIVGTGGYMGNIPFRTHVRPADERTFDAVQHRPDGPAPRGRERHPGRHEGRGGPRRSFPGLRSRQHGPAASIAFWPCSDVYDRVMPGHPAFEFIRSYGIIIGTAGWEYIIAVNQVGKRFHDEISTGAERGAEAKYPLGSSGTNKPFTPLDWRNASVAHVRSSLCLGIGLGRGDGHERRLARSGLLLGAGLGDLRPGSGRCQWMAAPLPLYRRSPERDLLQGGYDR